MKLFLTFFVFSLLHSFVYAQEIAEKDVKNNSCSQNRQAAVREYFNQLESAKNFITQCESETEEIRKAANLNKPKKISGFFPSAISLVKPYYPNRAKKLRISGEVLVEVIVDENGNVIYSKILKGNSLLGDAAKKAACKSKFTPVLYCSKPVKRLLIIKYLFLI